ncbi:MAG: sigma-54-dependent transcriptional regulator [Gemmatimonadales bacterium]
MAAAALALDPVALSSAMVEALRRAKVYAPASTPIVLVGATGTGKTFFADFIHRLSKRPDGFRGFSVGTAAPLLVLDDLFGHVEGAYTDARRPRVGWFATVGRGTLLLDDFQNLARGAQKQLLQVLDHRTYSPIGSSREVPVECRVIIAMNEPPDALVERGRLLPDLRHRLGYCEIRFAGLAERRGEIATLAARFLAECRGRTGVDGPARIAPEAVTLLEGAPWPGNLRQLQGELVLAYLEARADGAAEIQARHLHERVRTVVPYKRRGDPEENWRAISRALAHTGGRVDEAARLLGVSRATIFNARARVERLKRATPETEPAAE